MSNHFFYLHTWSMTGFDDQTINENKDTQTVENIGIMIDFWPADDLFSIAPLFFVTERLRSILKSKKFPELEFKKITRIVRGSNFVANFPDAELPDWYWEIKINGNIGVDDFSVWQNSFLIVSERALHLLRDNHVTHAEADLIEIPFENYFNSSKKYFWMPDNMKHYFEKMDAKKNHPKN